MNNIIIENEMVKFILADLEFAIVKERSNKKRSLAVSALNSYYRSFNIVVFEYLKYECGYEENSAADTAIKYTTEYMKSKGYIK